VPFTVSVYWLKARNLSGTSKTTRLVQYRQIACPSMAPVWSAGAGVRERLGAPAAAPAAAAGPGPLVVDSLGKRCPIPVIELAKVIGDVPVGGTVTVLADDEAARLDIPAWCEMRGQEYVGEEPSPRGGTGYVVRRLT
uniref:sulfurtransferase TusA family protein n=1 Tax=Streptomyces sp. TaxID=1931 RepID=UPI002811CEFB